MSAPSEAPNVKIPKDLYNDLVEYLEQREDVRDGADGVQLPNEAMTLLERLRTESRHP